MTPRTKTKILALLLATPFCFFAVSCSKTPPETTATAEGPTQEEEYLTTPLPSGEILSQTENWTARSETGPLDEASSCHIVDIKTKADLDPYRSYLTELSAEDEARILADQKGKCVLLEITSSGSTAFYSVNSIMRNSPVIEIVVTEEISTEKEPFHTFFLFYFSSEIYRGETVQTVLFGS